MRDRADVVGGSHGHAERISAPDGRAADVVTAWLVTSPEWAPLLPMGNGWTQWLVGCTRLGEVADLPQPYHQFEGTTHEVLVMTLSPDHGPYAAEDFWGQAVQFLEPQNVVVQFIATDDEMREVTDLVVQAVVDGNACPESWRWPGGNVALTEAWLTIITKTLAHIRGEAHAR